jgi:hypothetical protein
MNGSEALIRPNVLTPGRGLISFHIQIFQEEKRCYVQG